MTWRAVYAPYLKSVGVSPSLYGVLGSTYSLSGLIGMAVSSIVIARIGLVRTLIMTTLLRGFALAGFGATKEFSIFMALAFVNGFAASINFIALEVCVSYLFPREKLEHAFSYLYAAMHASGAIGSFLAFLPEYISSNLGVEKVLCYAATMIIAGTFAAMVAGLLLRIEEPRVGLDRDRGFRLPTLARDFLSLGRALSVILLVEILIAWGAGISIHNIDYYFMLKYGTGSTGIGMLHGFEEIGLTLLTLSMPLVSKVLGGGLRTYVIVSSTSIPLLVSMTLVSSFWIALAIFVARTVLMNAASPLFTAFVAKVVHPSARPRAFSLISIARTLTVAPARVVGGYLLSIDLEAPLRITACFYTAALLVLALRYWNARDHVETKQSSSH